MIRWGMSCLVESEGKLSMKTQKLSYLTRLFIVVISWVLFLVGEVFSAKILFPKWFSFVCIGFADSCEKAAAANSEMMYVRLFGIVAISIIFAGLVSWVVFRRED